MTLAQVKCHQTLSILQRILVCGTKFTASEKKGSWTKIERNKSISESGRERERIMKYEKKQEQTRI